MTPSADLLPRFTAVHRWVHRGLAVLVTVCLLTAAALSVGPVAVLVGDRPLVARVHVVAGLLLPLPVLLGLLSGTFRADLRRLDRFRPSDREWLRSRDRRSGRLPVGKFNAGQKLAAALVAGAVLVLLGTGLVMRYGGALSDAVRTGSTWVHDWTAYALLALVLGHLWFARRDPVSRAGLATGSVPRDWALREHRGWVEELDAEPS